MEYEYCENCVNCISIVCEMALDEVQMVYRKEIFQ